MVCSVQPVCLHIMSEIRPQCVLQTLEICEISRMCLEKMWGYPKKAIFTSILAIKIDENAAYRQTLFPLLVFKRHKTHPTWFVMLSLYFCFVWVEIERINRTNELSLFCCASLQTMSFFRCPTRSSIRFFYFE